MSRLFQWLRRRLCGSELDRQQARIEELEAEIETLQPPDYPDVATTTVPKDAVEDALSELDGWGLKQAYWWDDYSYRVPVVEDFEGVAAVDAINSKEYVDEYFDCDNYADHFSALFAREFTVNAVGVVISPDAEPPHAFTVVVVDNGGEIEARLWEPQDDRWVTDSDDPKYILDGALIRI